MGSSQLTDRKIDSLTEQSIIGTKELIEEAASLRSRLDVSNRRMFARMLKDSKAIGIAIALSDEVLRIKSKKHASKILFKISKNASVYGFGLFNALALRLAGVVGLIFPKLVLGAVMLHVKQISKEIILSSNKEKLKRHIRKRSDISANLNINVLGEAVLGEEEANLRFEKTIEMMRREEVNYVSVKISSICSQIITVDHQGTVERVVEKLRIIYMTSLETKTFVNLDMEEFRDLWITVDAFKILLLERPFQKLYAGIVLQAYLPEAHGVFNDLLLWAKERHSKYGGKIKIRLVKGANLEMEKIESELEGWSSATYPRKDFVDASYLRLIDLGLREDYKEIVDLGIASHNLFHLSFALQIAKHRGVLGQMDIEMLEGMANAEALLLSSKYKKVLFYTPVTGDNDFASAIAYLVRRFDENTSAENYLAASFSISSSNETYIEQEGKFLKAVSDRHKVITNSIRHGIDKMNRNSDFFNVKNSDMTDPLVREGIKSEIKEIINSPKSRVPIVINGQEIFDREVISSGDPSNEGEIWYEYAIARENDIKNAFNIAKDSVSEWNNLGTEGIERVLNKASLLMNEERQKLIALMARDAGKTIKEADVEVSEAVDFANYYGFSSIKNSLFEKSTPLGVVVVAPPWNFPYAIPAGGVCSALASGNAVIIKPAPETVMTAWFLVQQLWRAGVPKSVLHFIPTKDDEIGRTLITHKDAGAVILTGSIETAKLFKSWKPEMNIMAETSGKNSIIVTACCDTDLAVKDLVHSAFGHAGQKCSAASIGIIDSSVIRNSSFIKQLKDAVRSISVGIAWEPSVNMGPIIKPPSGKLDKAFHYLEEGEKWLIIPVKLDKHGYLWSPGVKTGVKPQSWSHQTEWFGPVLGLMESPDLETSIKWQNSTQYGLTSGIHSLDVAEVEEWINSTEAGNLYVNRGVTGAVVSRQPFGGWKNSSYGVSAKAGGSNYVTNLRVFEELTDPDLAIKESELWLDNIGYKVLKNDDMTAEINYSKFKNFLKPILIRVDSKTPDAYLQYLEWVKRTFKNNVSITYKNNSNIEMSMYEKVRWLSSDEVPHSDLFTYDSRKLCQRGDIEIRRWLAEQTISITSHRYGNINAGPKPIVKSDLK